MHSIRPRPICRARNTFSLSTVLWQHFIAPSARLPQRPLTSLFTTEATQSRDDDRASPNRKESSENLIRKVSLERSNRPGRNDAKRLKPIDQHGDGKNNRARTGFRGEMGQDALKMLAKAHDAYHLAEDYTGMIVHPVIFPRVKDDTYPWVVPDWRNIQSGLERLNLEIKNFHKYIRPSPVERIARKHVIEQVREHVRECLPGYSLEIFGSQRTGLAFAGSDIDLRLIPNDVLSDAVQSKLPPDPIERSRRRGHLRRLHTNLVWSQKKHYLLPVLRWARYPLITMQDRSSGLDVQIVLSNDTSNTRKYVERYQTEYSSLPELYSVIKAALDVRGLTDVFRGGIGSYSLFMMIVASLKHGKTSKDDAASALINFLHFWGTFDASTRGVSIEPPEFFEKQLQPVMNEKAMSHIAEGKTTRLPTWMLTLRDPADETNDLGRKIIAWKHVQETFKNMHRDLRTKVKYNNYTSLIGHFVGPVYELQGKHRQKLTDYGRSLAQAARRYSSADRDTRGPMYRVVEQGDTGLRSHTLDDVAAVAKAIRQDETADRHTGSKAAPTNDNEDGLNPWLKEASRNT